MNLIDRNKALIDSLAAKYSVEARAVCAILRVEARGEGLVDGRPIIRLEVNKLWLAVDPRRRNLVDARFRVDGPRPWEGHQFLRTPANWVPLHQAGQQGLEWEAFGIARDIDAEAAVASTSWGCGQVMGQHWRALGFESAARFVDYQMKETGQIDTVMRFLDKVGGALDDLRAKRWTEVARRYNGNGAVPWYAGRLAGAYERG